MSSLSVLDILKKRILEEKKHENEGRERSMYSGEQSRDENQPQPQHRDQPVNHRDRQSYAQSQDRQSYAQSQDRQSHDRRDQYRERDSGRREYPDRNHGRREYREYNDNRYERNNNGGRRGYQRDDRRNDDRRNDYRRNDRRDRDDYHRNDYRRDDRRDFRREERKPASRNQHFTEEEIANAVPINMLKREKTLFDVKPKGFEKISSERAKISGLFPLPGEEKHIDISKLQGLVSKGDINSQTAILFEQVNISNSVNSKISKQLIISGIEFTLFPVERLIEYLNKFIDNLELPECSTSTILSYELIGKKLVLRLSDPTITTLVFCAYKFFRSDLNLNIIVERPENYITPNPLYDDKEEENEATKGKSITPKIKDSKDKICIFIPQELNKSDVETFFANREIQFINDNSGNFKNFIFLNKLENETEFKINDINLEWIFASKGLDYLPQEISYRNIKELVKLDDIKINNSNSIILLNLINPEELKNELVFNQFKQEVLNECNKFGKVVEIKIPKPTKEYRRNLKFLNSSIGKVFVKFGNENEALSAVENLSGKKFNERTILSSFIPEKDFDLNIY